MPAGKLEFRSNIPRHSVVCWMGNDPPKISAGYGGWEVVERPRRAGLTQWTGREPFQVQISIVLDGWIDRQPIDYQIDRLERMAMPYKKEPPVIMVIGGAMPHAGLDWVIETIDWGDAIKNTDGETLRQEGVVTLRSYIAADKIQLSAAAKKRQSKGK
jgi:hypothetical protein